MLVRKTRDSPELCHPLPGDRSNRPNRLQRAPKGGGCESNHSHTQADRQNTKPRIPNRHDPGVLDRGGAFDPYEQGDASEAPRKANDFREFPRIGSSIANEAILRAIIAPHRVLGGVCGSRSKNLPAAHREDLTMKHLRNAVLGGTALFLILAVGTQAWADPSPSDAGKEKAEATKAAATKPVAPTERPKPDAADPGVATAAAAKEGKAAEGKGTSPPAAEAHAQESDSEGEGDDEDADKRGPRRMNAAQEAYRRARERFLSRTQDTDPGELSERDKKHLEMAQKALEKARTRLQTAHLKKPSERMTKEDREAFEKRLQELHEARQKNREERTKEQRAELKERFKDAEPNPAITAELKHHAWRVARLLRLKELAAAGERAEIVERVEELMEKENARHEKHLAHLKEGGGAREKDDKSHEPVPPKGAAKTGVANAAKKKEGAK